MNAKVEYLDLDLDPGKSTRKVRAETCQNDEVNMHVCAVAAISVISIIDIGYNFSILVRNFKL